MVAPWWPVKTIRLKLINAVEMLTHFLILMVSRYAYHNDVMIATATPPHLCHCKAAVSYPSSLERNNPIKAVNDAIKADNNNNPSPIFLTASFVRNFFSNNKNQKI